MSLEAGAVLFFKDKDWAQFGLGSVRKIKNKEVEIHFTQFKGFKVEKRIKEEKVKDLIQKGYIVVRPPLPKGVDRRKKKEERIKRISSNAYLILRAEEDIITGDIVDDGHEEQYERVYEALEPFKKHIFLCPGNHDFGAAGNLYSWERAERFDKFLSLPLKQGGTFTGDSTPVVNVLKENNDCVMIIALDTNLETENPFDFACGEVGNKQLAALNTILSHPTTANIKILFFHHHPFIHNDPFLQLNDARELMRTIYSRVDVVLFGHKHVSNLWKNINGIQFVLASDNSPGKDFAREIVIEQKTIAVKDIPISV